MGIDGSGAEKVVGAIGGDGSGSTGKRTLVAGCGGSVLGVPNRSDALGATGAANAGGTAPEGCGVGSGGCGAGDGAMAADGCAGA